jgi:hypothetical protein
MAWEVKTVHGDAQVVVPHVAVHVDFVPRAA